MNSRFFETIKILFLFLPKLFVLLHILLFSSSLKYSKVFVLTLHFCPFEQKNLLIVSLNVFATFWTVSTQGQMFVIEFFFAILSEPKQDDDTRGAKTFYRWTFYQLTYSQLSNFSNFPFLFIS